MDIENILLGLKQKSIKYASKIKIHVNGNSMRPTFLHNQEVVFLAKNTKKDFSICDIVVFLHPKDKNRYIVHRVKKKIIKCGKTYYKTKGDASLLSDPYTICEKDIIAYREDKENEIN